MKSLKIGPNGVTSLVNQDITELFTEDNCIVVFRADGNYESWKPGRDINAFDTLEQGIGYIVIMLETLDVTEVFSEGTGGAGLTGLSFINASNDNVSFHWKNNANANVGTLQTINAGAVLAIKQLSDIPAGAVSIAWTVDLTPYSLSVSGFNKTSKAFDSGDVIKNADINIYPTVDVAGNLAGDEAIVFVIGQPLTKVQINNFTGDIVWLTPNGAAHLEASAEDTTSFPVKNMNPAYLTDSASIKLSLGGAFKVKFSRDGEGGAQQSVDAGDEYVFDLSLAKAKDISITVYQDDAVDHYVEISNYSTHQWAINNSDGGATLQTLEAGAGATFLHSQLLSSGVTSGLTLVATDGTSFSSLMQRPNADPYRNDAITTNFSFSTIQATHSLDDGDIKVQIIDRA